MRTTIARTQSGYVAIAMLVMLMSASVVFAVRFAGANQSSQAQPENDAYRQSALNALEDARLRLLASALRTDAGKTNPGTFPCPDNDNSGSEPSCTAINAQLANHLPYKVLQPLQTVVIPAANRTAIQDSEGQCLWYALSPSFRNSLDPAIRESGDPNQLPINPDTVGGLQYNKEKVIAVLIAPGAALPAQSRCTVDGNGCPPASCAASNYLEKFADSDNAGSTAQFADSAFVTAIDKSNAKCVVRSSIRNPADIGDACNNDVVLPIRSSDLMKPLIRKVLEELAVIHDGVDSIPALRTQLASQVNPVNLATVRDVNPLAFDQAVFSSVIGPQGNGCYKTTKIGTLADPRPLWLCANQWYGFIKYNPAGQSLSITLNESIPTAKYGCTLSLTTRTTTCQ